MRGASSTRSSAPCAPAARGGCCRASTRRLRRLAGRPSTATCARGSATGRGSACTRPSAAPCASPRAAATRVEPANLHDQRGAKGLLAGLAPLQPRLAVVYADGAYAGAHLRDWCAAHAGVELRVVRRPERHRFVVIPKRWIVERTFAWLGRNRRLAKANEARPQTTGVLMAVAMIGLMLRRLTRRC